MLSLKSGAKLEGLKAEILFGLLVVKDVFSKYGIEDLVVTEGTGGVHMQGSLHYQGLAVDIRSKNIPEGIDKQAILTTCKTALGLEFDMIIEDLGSLNEHLHLEFDPK